MTEIKPCPLCGGDNIARIEQDDREFILIGCLDCWTQGPSKITEAEAIDAWNTRVPAPSLLNGLGEAREALNDLVELYGDHGPDGELLPAEEQARGQFYRAMTTLSHLDTLLAQEGK